MEIFIFSKQQFDDLMIRHNITNDNIIERDIMFISINDSNTENIFFKENKSNLLIIKFDDVSENEALEYNQKNETKLKAFDENDAKNIISFIEQNKDKKSCIIHCSAGISRSGAVGLFINDYFNLNYKEFIKTNPHIHPNQHILRVLNNTYRNYEI